MANLCFHFSFSIFSLLCLMVCPTFSHTNFTTDELALLAFKYSVRDPYNHLANWSNSSSICNWVGVTCDAHHGRVRILNLGEMGLIGTLPSRIGNLFFLAELDLHTNNFYGELPKELLQLHKLKILNLSYNGFNGEIPTSISNLSMLETLDLSYNFIKGSISPEIGRLQHLKILWISKNNLSGIIPTTISNLSSLEQITLSHNSLTGEIPKRIDGLTNLNSIGFSINQLSGHIPKNIGNLTLLQELYLADNNLTGLIPMEIGNLHKLEILQLSLNKLSGSIPLKIFNMSSLKVFSLANNSMLGSLPSNFGCCLPNLQELYLWGNKLSGRIPNTISNASKLANVELGPNKFEGFLPSTLGHLKYLEVLQLYDNNLSIIDASSWEANFLSSLSNCRHLKVLDLSVNPLDIKLPKSIGNLSDSLQVLTLDDCGISGNIPAEIGNLSSLFKLALEKNFLDGPIPITISHLQSLQFLGFTINKLHGKIVDELCEIRGLAFLFLRGNKFSGKMPLCLGNLTSLREIYLDSNMLTSEIPSSFWNVTEILQVDLSYNMLSGNLSSKIGNLKALIYLDLSRNRISGNIPMTIGSLQNLQILSLAHNNLQGNIPKSFANLLGLESLDLSQNDLSGEIPKSLELLVYLKYVNLSYNKLQGEIPSGGVFKNLTAESFMMNEALCGWSQLKVPLCKIGRGKRSMLKLLVLKFITPFVASTILVILGFILFRCKQQNSRGTIERDSSYGGVPRRISYFEILEATNGFDESNLLGRGSYGVVFKGELLSGKMVAIKIFNFDSEVISRSFEVECNILRNVRHRNLVKVINTCSNVDFKSLVMEYMPNGNLDKWLYSHNYCLNFSQRLNIMINVASALEYLHHGLSTPVVHCDLKPSNILLDDDMIAHVSDFGISKLLDEGHSKTHTETIPTIGYISPEYGFAGVVSTKVDAYSYGIILLEVFTRKKPTEYMFVSGLSLKNWVSESMQHAIDQVIDSNLLQGDEQHIGNVLRATSSIFKLALNCCADIPETRSTMTDAVVTLNKIRVMFEERQQLSYLNKH